MKHIAVFFNRPRFEDEPFDDAACWEGYHAVGKLLAQKGAQFIVVRSQRTYLGNGRFSRGWAYRDGAFVVFDESFVADVIWNKGDFIGEPETNIINDPELGDLTMNKWKTYGMFPSHHPKTLLVEKHEDLQSALKELSTPMVVIKPVDGEGGEGVFIGSREDAVTKTVSFPCVVQNFIDTGHGIPGLVPGHHDLRLVCIRGEIVLSYARVPEDGLVSNVALGGHVVRVPLGALPEGAKELLRQVDAKMAQFRNRFYCTDMGLDSDGRWKIIEMNSQPGMVSHAECGEDAETFNRAIAELLATA